MTLITLRSERVIVIALQSVGLVIPSSQAGRGRITTHLQMGKQASAWLTEQNSKPCLFTSVKGYLSCRLWNLQLRQQKNASSRTGGGRSNWPSVTTGVWVQIVIFLHRIGAQQKLASGNLHFSFPSPKFSTQQLNMP